MAKRIFFFCIIVAIAFSSNLSLATSRIKLDESTDPTGVLKSIYQPIILFDNTVGSLELLFRSNFGQVSIVVEDELGNVFHYNNLQITNNDTWSIPCDEWEHGDYTLFITTPNKVYTWEFEILE